VAHCIATAHAISVRAKIRGFKARLAIGDSGMRSFADFARRILAPQDSGRQQSRRVATVSEKHVP
jgi:hypothetical protein